MEQRVNESVSARYGLDADRLPAHVAIIMDGNGRWARQRGNMRPQGHKAAVKAVRDTVEGAAELGLSYLTLFAFSTENWKRPALEVEALMQLLVSTLKKERNTLLDNGVRLASIGNVADLPKRCQEELQETVEATAGGEHMTLTLALSYGARHDLANAMRHLAEQVKQGLLQPQDIQEEHIAQALSTRNMPDPELLIRTSGEFRISNYLLWEIAYTELYVSPLLWPDFRREHLAEALLNYQQRERRFGKTSDQLRGS